MLVNLTIIPKNKHISNDKRVATSVVEQNNPFNMVSIQGRVIVNAMKTRGI
jgi:hypothetical protein